MAIGFAGAKVPCSSDPAVKEKQMSTSTETLQQWLCPVCGTRKSDFVPTPA